jgi:hypothetical protein
MQMSAACTPAVQPYTSPEEQRHPRYAEYLAYRGALSLQLVTASTFACWLRSTEEHENGKTVIFEVTSTTARLAPGWYRNEFAPRRQMPETFGPFATRDEASA